MRLKWDRHQGRPEPIRALNRIMERENDDLLVDLREAAPRMRILRPQVIPYVRSEVARMCARASEALPEGVYLGIVEGWRPLSRQQRIYDFMWEAAKEAFPERDNTALRRTVCRWVAPTDQKAPPGHCTGAAVDVWLVDEENEPIDVASPYDRWQAAPTFTLGLSTRRTATGGFCSTPCSRRDSATAATSGGTTASGTRAGQSGLAHPSACTVSSTWTRTSTPVSKPNTPKA